jgi:uncharacterized protein (TIGR00297 family)
MIVNDRKKSARGGGIARAIPARRDRIQSELLVGAVGMVLLAKATLEIAAVHRAGPMPGWFWASCGFSAGFAVVVVMLRAATVPAAAMGGLMCLHVLQRQELGVGWRETAMPSLLALFVLTFAATRFGRAKKEAFGVAESRRGRRASQVAANLGVAGTLAAGGTPGSFAATAMLAACVAALAEATADTTSSEMGQALGGRTLLITTGKVVAPGTDGGVSLAGTAYGALAAAVVVAVSPLGRDWRTAAGVFGAACAGLVFDSVLGATVERRGWMGNDWVNFASTVFAAVVAWWAMALL